MSTTPDEASERRAQAAARARVAGQNGPGRGAGDEQDGPQDGLRKLLVGVGAVVLLGAMVAAAVIYSGGGGTTGQHTPPLRLAATTHGLAIGKAAAPVHVVVYEDFLQPASAQLEMGSRDFLHTDAAAGRAYVEYRPVAPAGSAATRATNAFLTVLHVAGARAALRFHDLLFARQATSPGSVPDDAELVSLAVQAGARKAAVETPIAHRSHQGWVNRANAAASVHSMDRLPRVLVGGHVLSAPTQGAALDRLETVIARKG